MHRLKSKNYSNERERGGGSREFLARNRGASRKSRIGGHRLPQTRRALIINIIKNNNGPSSVLFKRMQPARCRWSCRGTRRPRKLRSCLDRVAIDPHRSRASIRLLPCAPHLPPPSLLALLSSPPRLASPSRAAPQENGKIQADTGPRRQTTTFSRKRPGSRIRSDDRSLPCKTG